MTKTRFAELSFERYGTTWRFVDTSTGQTVGPHYVTKDELLADVNRFGLLFTGQDKE